MRASRPKTAELDRYVELVRDFPLRPLRSERDLDRAVKRIDSLLDRDRLSGPERDYLEVLGDLVERYEEKRQPISPLPDAEMLRYLMEAKGVSQARVARETGISGSTLSAVISGTRRLTRDHIGKLARYFSVGSGVFA